MLPCLVQCKMLKWPSYSAWATPEPCTHLLGPGHVLGKLLKGCRIEESLGVAWQRKLVARRWLERLLSIH